MAKFVLKEPRGKDSTIIYLIYNFSGQRLKYSTGKKVKPVGWNPVRQRIRKDYPNSKALNILLDKLTYMVEDAHTTIVTDGGIVNVENIRRELDRALNRKKARETFIEFIERYVRDGSHKQTSKTIFNTVLSHLKKYPGKKDFNDITPAWFESYVGYLESKDFSVNYIRKNLSTLKQFMNEAVEVGITQNVSYRTRKSTIAPEEAVTIYLSIEELLALKNAVLSEPQSRVRDLFLIGAFTGLRFSDFSQLTQDNIGEDFIRIRTQKTGELVVIPLHWAVRDILNKYDGKLPRAISNQKMNDALKLIARRSGLEDLVIKSRTNGGERTSKTFKKWELVTTHTARRSFATNIFIAGVPSISIMKITGHRTEKSFLKYIKISQEQNARLLAGHDFFTAPASPVAEANK